MPLVSPMVATHEGVETHKAFIKHKKLSGNGARSDGKIRFGFAMSQNRREYMEDFHAAEFKMHEGLQEEVGLFGVFDGHGGPKAADYARQKLFENILASPFFPSDIDRALDDGFKTTDADYLRKEDNTRSDGSTAVVALVVRDTLYVANVGDSRAVLCSHGNVIPMSQDHKPDLQSERQRIEDAGGFVMWRGTWRVGGTLAVSRAIGDRSLKEYVVAEPHIDSEHLSGRGETLVLACDGIWDVLSNEDVGALVGNERDEERAAQSIVQRAEKLGSRDNLTAIVVHFDFRAGKNDTKI